MDLYTLTQEMRDSAIHCSRVWVICGGLDVVWEVAPGTFVAVVRDNVILDPCQFNGTSQTTTPMIYGWHNLVALYDDCVDAASMVPATSALNNGTLFLRNIVAGLCNSIKRHMRVRMDTDAT